MQSHAPRPTPPLWAGWNEYAPKAGGIKQTYCAIHQPVSMVLQCDAGAWLKELVSGDQCCHMGSDSVFEVYYT